jgi:L-lactate utilization protein LutB
MSNPIASNETVIETTAAAVMARGISVEVVNNRADALERIKSIIPAGVTVMTGASLTLKEIGFEEYLISKTHPWKNLKDDIVNETDPARQAALRKESILADYFLGSVHAVAETGEL